MKRDERIGLAVLALFVIAAVGWGFYRWTFDETESTRKSESKHATMKARVVEVPSAKQSEGPSSKASQDTLADSIPPPTRPASARFNFQARLKPNYSTSSLTW